MLQKSGKVLCFGRKVKSAKIAAVKEGSGRMSLISTSRTIHSAWRRRGESGKTGKAANTYTRHRLNTITFNQDRGLSGYGNRIHSAGMVDIPSSWVLNAVTES